MLYQEYIDKVKELALVTDERNGVTYVRPDYEYLIAASDLKLEDVTDFEDVSKTVVYRQLLLERDMRNAQNDNTPIVMQWIYDVISNVIEPAIVEEQNKLIKDMLEYRKERNAIDNRTKELDQKERELEEKNKVVPFTFGMNFSKKKP